MTATINATTSQGVVVTPDNSGTLSLQSNGVTGLNLDSAGRLLTPTRPSFYIRKTGSQSAANGTVVTFDTVVTNIGSCYNTSTNLFTAPVAGFYSFTAKIWLNRSTLAYAAFSPCLNGTQLSGTGAYTDASGVSSGNLTYIVNIQYYLNANDTFSFKIDCPSSTVSIDNSGYFSGFLIG